LAAKPKLEESSVAKEPVYGVPIPLKDIKIKYLLRLFNRYAGNVKTIGYEKIQNKTRIGFKILICPRF
jgi:hypothetical protein